MPQSLSQTLTTLSPYHLLFYSTLLGSQLYQTFVITKLTFTALPLGVFMNLNKKTFPAYFRIQTALIAATVLTYPPAPGLLTVLWDLLVRPVVIRWSSGSFESTRTSWTLVDVSAMLLMAVPAVLNLLVYGPKAQAAMVDRSHQETRDSKLSKNDAAATGSLSKQIRGEDGAPSAALRARRYFSRMHAMSIHLNLISIIGTLLYGVSLAGRFEVAK